MKDSPVQELFFVLGEAKYVKSRVYPTDDNEVVIINNAVFDLIRLRSGKTEASGKLIISGRDMKALISPLSAEKYILIETISVGGEIFKKRINITVTQR